MRKKQQWPRQFVSPSGNTVQEVVSPVVAVRLRARGWLPLDEAGLDWSTTTDSKLKTDKN